MKRFNVFVLAGLPNKINGKISGFYVYDKNYNTQFQECSSSRYLIYSRITSTSYQIISSNLYRFTDSHWYLISIGNSVNYNRLDRLLEG